MCSVAVDGLALDMIAKAAVIFIGVGLAPKLDSRTSTSCRRAARTRVKVQDDEPWCLVIAVVTEDSSFSRMTGTKNRQTCPHFFPGLKRFLKLSVSVSGTPESNYYPIKGNTL